MRNISGNGHWAWPQTAVILALRKLRQEDFHEFRPTQAT